MASEPSIGQLEQLARRGGERDQAPGGTRGSSESTSAAILPRTAPSVSTVCNYWCSGNCRELPGTLPTRLGPPQKFTQYPPNQRDQISFLSSLISMAVKSALNLSSQSSSNIIKAQSLSTFYSGRGIDVMCGHTSFLPARSRKISRIYVMAELL